MIEVVFLVLLVFCFLGALSRIADAIDAQNKHYGIGQEPEKKAEVA